MDQILSFFTETLSGATYWVVVVIAVILIFACIGYLGERKLKQKKDDSMEIVTDTPVPTVQNQPETSGYVSQIPNFNSLKEVSIYPPSAGSSSSASGMATSSIEPTQTRPSYVYADSSAIPTVQPTPTVTSQPTAQVPTGSSASTPTSSPYLSPYSNWNDTKPMS